MLDFAVRHFQMLVRLRSSNFQMLDFAVRDFQMLDFAVSYFWMLES